MSSDFRQYRVGQFRHSKYSNAHAPSHIDLPDMGMMIYHRVIYNDYRIESILKEFESLLSKFNNISKR